MRRRNFVSLPQEIWSSEVRCRHCLKSSTDLWRRAAGVGTWRRRRGLRSGDALQALPQKRYGDLEACCRCTDVEEAERYGAVEMRRRRADVEEAERHGALEMRCRRCLK